MIVLGYYLKVTFTRAKDILTYRFDIQILRGIAVLLVLFYHLKIPAFDNGYLGVDLFFVISGYLMASLYKKRTILSFYKARINRLLPSYLVVNLILLIICFKFTVASDFDQLTKQSSYSFFYLLNFYYWKSGSYFAPIEFNPLLHYWSLAVEVQFYLLVPLLFPLLRKFPYVLLFILIVSFVICIQLLQISPKTSFYMLPTRMWEFLIGALVGWLPNFRTKFFQSNLVFLSRLFCAGLFFCVIFFLRIDPDSKLIFYGHPALGSLLLCLIAGWLIYFGLGEGVENSFFGKTMGQLGNISYSLYLVHFPLLILWNYQPFGGTDFGAETVFEKVGLLITSVALAIVLYQLVERNYFFRFKNFWITGFVMASALLFNSAMNYLHWYIIPYPQNNILQAWNDRSKEYRCPTTFRIFNPNKRVCPLNNTKSEKALLLVGDSHADSIKEIVSNTAIKQNLQTFFTVNPPLLEKSPLNLNLLMESLKINNIEGVIIHYSLNNYNSEQFRLDLSKLVKVFYEKKIPVFIVGPTPQYSKSIPEYLYNNVLAKNLEKVELKEVGSHIGDLHDFYKFLNLITNKYTEFYDPAKIFCKEKFCEVASVDFQPYYFDDDHLTLKGAKKLAPFFIDISNKVVSKKR